MHADTAHISSLNLNLSLSKKIFQALAMNCMQRKLLCAHTFDTRSTLPATRRGSAVVDAAHAFCRSFAGQFTAVGDVHAKVHKSSLLQLLHF